MLKIGILGLGTISHIHKIAIEESSLGQLVAVCDEDPETHVNYQDYPFYSKLEEMLEQEDLDVVHVCLPHDLHVWAAKVCLKHDVHVLLEKPLALTYEEGKRLEQARASSQAKVAVCFQNRYNLTTQRLHQEVVHPKAGALKAVKGIVAWSRPESYYTEQPWRGQLKRAGGGTIINQSIHTLDLMHYFAGDVLRAKAKLFNLLDYDIEVEDTAAARFEFEHDVSGLYLASNAYEENSSVDLEVVCENAKFTIKDYRLYRYVGQDEPVLVCEDEQLATTKSYYGQGHKLCIESFYQALIDGTNDFVTIEDALPSMLMIDLMRLSSQTDQEVDAQAFIQNHERFWMTL